jgi:hypothetical protein
MAVILRQLFLPKLRYRRENKTEYNGRLVSLMFMYNEYRNCNLNNLVVFEFEKPFVIRLQTLCPSFNMKAFWIRASQYNSQ